MKITILYSNERIQISVIEIVYSLTLLHDIIAYCMNH